VATSCSSSNGVEDPPPGAISLIAAAFGLEPSYFVEYRLALLREAFDERVSFEDAVRNLVAVEPALDELRLGIGATHRGYVSGAAAKGANLRLTRASSAGTPGARTGTIRKLREVAWV
jgi:hypothetical protein